MSTLHFWWYINTITKPLCIFDDISTVCWYIIKSAKRLCDCVDISSKMQSAHWLLCWYIIKNAKWHLHFWWYINTIVNEHFAFLSKQFVKSTNSQMISWTSRTFFAASSPFRGLSWASRVCIRRLILRRFLLRLFLRRTRGYFCYYYYYYFYYYYYYYFYY